MKTREPSNSPEDASFIEQKIAAEDQDDAGPGGEIFKEGLLKIIPSGMKAVNLPVTVFGKCLDLKEGDRVDIISTFYDREAGILDSEKIISAREIIALETGGEPGMEDKISLGSSIISNEVSVASRSVDMGNILVITFFLRDEEVLKSFKAIESGILYLALCSTGREEGIN